MKMGFLRQPLFLSHILLMNLVSLALSQPDFLGYFCNYTSNSVYETNRNTALSSLISNTNEYGFYNSSYGENGSTVYASALCRADVKIDPCRECINNATSKLKTLCPAPPPPPTVSNDEPKKAAVGWYDNCMLRYANTSMVGVMALDPRIFVWNDKKNVTSVAQFTDALKTLLDSLRVKAASGGAQRKFASGNAPGPNSQTVYALVQCTPDLSEKDCSNCLNSTFQNIEQCCGWGPAGGRVITPSCHFRYELGAFVGEIEEVSASPNGSPTATPSPTTTNPTSSVDPTAGTAPPPPSSGASAVTRVAIAGTALTGTFLALALM